MSMFSRRVPFGYVFCEFCFGLVDHYRVISLFIHISLSLSLSKLYIVSCSTVMKNQALNRVVMSLPKLGSMQIMFYEGLLDLTESKKAYHGILYSWIVLCVVAILYLSYIMEFFICYFSWRLVKIYSHSNFAIWLYTNMMVSEVTLLGP